MSDDRLLNLVQLLLVLVLVLSALAAHRPSTRSVGRIALAWAGIVLVITAIVVNRGRIQAVANTAMAALGLSEQQVVGGTVRLRMSEDGHFWARVTLNGVSTRMLVDSGATMTALSERTARAAGLPQDHGGFPVMVETANGTVPARRATVRTLNLGAITAHDLGVQVSGSFGDIDILGMNFLSRLKSWRVEGDTMILEPQPGEEEAGKQARKQEVA